MIIPVVDKKDHIIGYKNRKDVTTSDIYRVSALWLINDRGEFLIAQRAFTKKHDPGKWGPAVAGTVEKGETYTQNIIKEALEEIGLQGLVLKKGPKFFRHSHWKYFTQWYIGIVVGRPKIRFQKKEVAAVQWLTYKEFLRLYQKDPDQFLRRMLYTARRFKFYLKT